eukprot:CAMPEP_0194226024 /NCGR_PEP_ID=MMETSP0156-20130528/40923_1 /TAXON_ID=33649 /ORGANISM="Thalassionema nitzschioides, Strain L26-B" /LENGTH=268 /DNA_ID=CAMNT_0038958203 /DNA_START=56 /DNA_END=862 /DNA_ORIENTATION=+
MALVAGRKKSTVVLDSASKNHPVGPPTPKQLRLIFLNTAIPMVGFGFMDQTIMLQAGNAIDCTIGVMFGLSTLTAAAFGQVCSDGAGVLFGRSLEQLASSVGIPKSGVTAAQRALPIVKKAKLAGNFIGVVFGCTLGLVNLFFIDTTRSTTLKLGGDGDGSVGLHFSVKVSNEEHEGATSLRLFGPDVDGLLVSMATALSTQDCSLIELHAKRDDNSERKGFDGIFHVVKRSTGEPFDDNELEDLAKTVLNSAHASMKRDQVSDAIHK